MLKLVTDPTPEPILDERRDLLRMLESLFTSPVVTLEEVTSRSKGAYALLYSGDLPFYSRIRRPGGRDDASPIAAGGGYPIYVGSSIQGLAERAGRHVNNLRDLDDISAADLRVILLPAMSAGGAVHIERALIDELRPVWNQSFVSGFGSRAQGRAREHSQKVAPWNVLHTGRRVADGAPRRHGSRVELQRRVAQFVGSVSGAYSVALFPGT